MENNFHNAANKCMEQLLLKYLQNSFKILKIIVYINSLNSVVPEMKYKMRGDVSIYSLINVNKAYTLLHHTSIVGYRQSFFLPF